MNILHQRQEGDSLILIVEGGVTRDVDFMFYGWINTDTPHTPERQVALMWDEARNIVNVGGVDGLTEVECGILAEAGFKLPLEYTARIPG
jgi:hypothetical protein